MFFIQKAMLNLPIFTIFLTLVACTEASNSQNKPNTKTNKVFVSKPNISQIKKALPTVKKQVNLNHSSLDGTYAVTHQGSEILITLSSKSNVITGTFNMNSQQAKINGVVKNLICTGNIVEDETGKTYAFNADRNGENLNFSFTVPEQNNQLVKLVLKKVTTQSKSVSSLAKNPMLIGTWRNTEVLSSGSGAFYSSFATDYFVKLDATGTAFIWTGKSAGGSNGITIESAKPGSVQKMEWFTEGKLLYLVNHLTRKKAPVSFYVETNRMMLTSGSNKKVYQRVN